MAKAPSGKVQADLANTYRRRSGLPDLALLEAFVAVCECGSMALAAKHLGCSQSAVTQMIKSIEKDFGVSLFDRQVRPVVLTHSGRTLLDLAVKLLASARHAADQVRRQSRGAHPLVRLGCVDSFAATVGPELVRALSGTANQIQIWSGLTPTLVLQLQGRELDFAVCTDPEIGNVRIDHTFLFSEPLVAVFPKSASPSDLKRIEDVQEAAGDLDLIRYSQRSVIGRQVERWLQHAGLTCPHRFEFDATDPLLSLIAAGLGWAISTPLCLWQSRQYLDRVTVLPLPATRLSKRNFFLVGRHDEWRELHLDVVRVTRRVLQHDTMPSIQAQMPLLAAPVFTYPDLPGG